MSFPSTKKLRAHPILRTCLTLAALVLCLFAFLYVVESAQAISTTSPLNAV